MTDAQLRAGERSYLFGAQPPGCASCRRGFNESAQLPEEHHLCEFWSKVSPAEVADVASDRTMCPLSQWMQDNANLFLTVGAGGLACRCIPLSSKWKSLAAKPTRRSTQLSSASRVDIRI